MLLFHPDSQRASSVEGLSLSHSLSCHLPALQRSSWSSCLCDEVPLMYLYFQISLHKCLFNEQKNTPLWKSSPRTYVHNDYYPVCQELIGVKEDSEGIFSRVCRRHSKWQEPRLVNGWRAAGSGLCRAGGRWLKRWGVGSEDLGSCAHSVLGNGKKQSGRRPG